MADFEDYWNNPNIIVTKESSNLVKQGSSNWGFERTSPGSIHRVLPHQGLEARERKYVLYDMVEVPCHEIEYLSGF